MDEEQLETLKLLQFTDAVNSLSQLRRKRKLNIIKLQMAEKNYQHSLFKSEHEQSAPAVAELVLRKRELDNASDMLQLVQQELDETIEKLQSLHGTNAHKPPPGKPFLSELKRVRAIL